YFKSHARKVHAAMDADPRVARARRVVRWITANGLERFSKRDAHQALKGTFRTVEDMDPILALLEKHAIIRAEPHQGRGGPGGSGGPSYEVHPQLSELYAQNPQNPQNPPPDTAADRFEDFEDFEHSSEIVGEAPAPDPFEGGGEPSDSVFHRTAQGTPGPPY